MRVYASAVPVRQKTRYDNIFNHSSVHHDFCHLSSLIDIAVVNESEADLLQPYGVKTLELTQGVQGLLVQEG